MRMALRKKLMLILGAVTGCSAAPVVETGPLDQPGVAVQIRVECADDAGAAFAGDAGARSGSDVTEIWECQRRCLEGCADDLCEVVSAPSVDVQRGCLGPEKPAVCMPRTQLAGQLVTGSRVCKTDPDWQTWALDPSRIPLGWYAAPYAVQARGAAGCELPVCDAQPVQ